MQTQIMTSNGGDSVVDYGSGSEVRRIRLGVQGTIDKETSSIAELKFGGMKVGYEDIYIRYQNSEQASMFCCVISIGSQAK